MLSKYVSGQPSSLPWADGPPPHDGFDDAPHGEEDCLHLVMMQLQSSDL
jgi:hypothetical protein